MRARRITLFVTLLLVVPMAGIPPAAGATTAAAQQEAELEMYSATVDAKTFRQLQEEGLDITAVEKVADGVEIGLVLSGEERDRLSDKGVDIELWRNGDGQTQSQLFAAQEAEGFQVFRPYDGTGGIEEEIRAIAADPRYRDVVELHDIGDTHEGRDILAIRMTQNVRRTKQGRRPAVLYQATAHAREWISTEVGRRLLHHYLDAWRSNDRTIRDILRTTEVWFVPVVNPDGYQYTFDGERLWRKNLRDNDGDGQITGNDGVDLNRNLPEHWRYDEEGSSSEFSSDTYRGPAPASEPETQANMALFDLADFEFAISYHSFGELLLYPQGWQTQTQTADDPIYVALTGTDDDPAVEGYDPGPSADLYTTNGEFTDWAHGTQGTLSWTPELAEGCEGCGFVFPDDEALVQAEFERNLPFALNVARSTRTPDDPVSHMDIETRDFYLDVAEIDPWKTNHPQSDLTFDVSYAGGGAQPVQVLAKRRLRNVRLHYRINGGRARSARTSPAPDGEVYGGNNAYNTHYHYLQGEIPGLRLGDTVEYWFSAGRSRSDRTQFDVVADGTSDVLVVAHEDRTGAVNIPGYDSTDPDQPNYLDFYTDAIKANNLDVAVYDIDAQGRQAPHVLGVLSHFDTVVWYMGNNFVTRAADRGPGNVDRLHNEMTLQMREYLNQGGSMLFTGQWAGALENGLAGGQYYDPVADEVCVEGGALVLDRCQFLADKNDFLQYYLGSYAYNSDAGTADPDEGTLFDVLGIADPYTGLGWGFNGDDSAANQGHTASHLTTSSILPPEDFPQFTSDAPAVWDTGAGGAFDPFDGDWYVYSQQGDISYKRLMRTIDLTGLNPGDDATLSFRFSYDIEPNWDFAFVEAHTVGEDDWTTLPEANDLTDTSTGDSCAEGWHELHPWLERYQGADCSGTGTSGEWHATSGRSAGWEPWEIDLSAYAGSEVEVAISYASDWAVQGIGAFVDAIEVSTGDGTTSFEDGLDGWEVTGPPEGSGPNPNDWIRTESVGFEEGAVVSTRNTLYFGFGFEGITGADTRADVMGRSIAYLRQ